MLQTLEKCNHQIKIEIVQIDILNFTKESREIGRREWTREREKGNGKGKEKDEIKENVRDY